MIDSENNLFPNIFQFKKFFFRTNLFTLSCNGIHSQIKIFIYINNLSKKKKTY
jgi:hypothetical protein